MEKIFIGVRDVDKEVFDRFRSNAVKARVKLGIALTEAMKKALMENKEKKNRIPKVKPFSFGKGSEKTSIEIDKILYGKDDIS